MNLGKVWSDDIQRYGPWMSLDMDMTGMVDIDRYRESPKWMVYSGKFPKAMDWECPDLWKPPYGQHVDGISGWYLHIQYKVPAAFSPVPLGVSPVKHLLQGEQKGEHRGC